MKKIPPYNKACPKCKNPCAFEGFNHVQCPNDECQNYSESQANVVTEWKQEQVKINDSYSKPINGDCLYDDDKEQHDEMIRSMQRLYQGYYTPLNTNNSAPSNASSTKDVTIDNCAPHSSLPSQPDPSDEYYDDGDYSFTDSVGCDDFDVY